MPEAPPELIEAFRRLGVRNPESWASSQVNEGIPQLARASLLCWSWQGIVSQQDTSWIDKEIRFYRNAEARKPGRGAILWPHAPALHHLLVLGATREEITTLVREMQKNAMWNFCIILDTIRIPPKELPISNFGAFELDENGNPLRRVGALHESLYQFDHEMHERKTAAKLEGGPAASGEPQYFMPPLDVAYVIERVTRVKSLRDLKPLVADLQILSGPVIFDALFPIAIRKLDAASGPVAMSAHALYALNPRCPMSVDDAVASLLPAWDLSIGEVPRYLAKQFGRDAIQACVERLRSRHVDNIGVLTLLRSIEYSIASTPAGS